MKNPQSIKSRLFQTGKSFGNAVLNIRDRGNDEFNLYAGAFHRAGRVLAIKMTTPPGYNDLEALPIIYTYRHALELYLKSLLHTGQTILHLSESQHNVSKKALQGHELTPLLPDIKHIFKVVGWEWKLEIEGLRSFEELKDLLQDFDNIDEKSFTFKYLIDKQNNPSVPIHFVVNIPIFCNQMNELLGLLDGATVLLKEERDKRLESAYESQKFIEDTNEKPE